ncbi:hypothetical protein [Epilithonimonas xixisoli]|uniref:Uncharacterized protein n=1 Tax=Epilithonimonas xixisoli TaxID=1476462 RepID=A0A4V3H2G1_9FLAO|nr:hypothetical protein [Epilithonimonas xixisoli]TDX83956.1 hypothetical protein B0I22_1544 [Epilithonimonas xixisoli]
MIEENLIQKIKGQYQTELKQAEATFEISQSRIESKSRERKVFYIRLLIFKNLSAEHCEKEISSALRKRIFLVKYYLKTYDSCKLCDKKFTEMEKQFLKTKSEWQD